MPTTRPRHFVTMTDDLAQALAAAASRWPELSTKRRLAALREHSGLITGAYGPDYVQRLREDWPA